MCVFLLCLYYRSSCLAYFYMFNFHNLLPKFLNSSGNNRNTTDFCGKKTHEHIYLFIFWSSSTGTACRLHSPSIVRSSMLRSALFCLHFKADGWSFGGWLASEPEEDELIDGRSIIGKNAFWSLIGWGLCTVAMIDWMVRTGILLSTTNTVQSTNRTRTKNTGYNKSKNKSHVHKHKQTNKHEFWHLTSF